MKNIIRILCLLCILIPSSLIASERVEDVFYDIDESYEYRDELQVLYDRGMIIPDTSGTFGPDSFLNRDEFVGISMEVICERCIQPHTEFEVIEKYFNEKVYFDLDNRNPYFYCIAEADTQNYVRGYDIGESCQNGNSQFGERPFCPLNRINLEEAVAVLLRNSGIHTIEDNREIINGINNGSINQNLSNDVSPKNSDGSAYTFYGYLQKALDYEILEYDTSGNQKTKKLLELDSEGNIFPEKQITKEEFLRMSYIVLKSNSCVAITKNEIALATDIYDASCSPGSENCTISDLNDSANIYDFSAKADGFCEDGIDDEVGHNWRFHNISNGEEFFRYGKYLDDILLPSVGEWRVYLTSKDRCGNSGQMYSTIVVEGNIVKPITGDIDIFPGLCDGNCGENNKIDSRDVGGDPRGDPDTPAGPDDPYDIVPDVTTNCPSGIDESSYRWTLTNLDTGVIITRTEMRIEDFVFPSSGEWKLELNIRSLCGDSFTERIFVNIPETQTPPIGDIDIFPGDCEDNCEELDPRDVGDDPVGDPDTPGGPDDPYDIVPDVTTTCPSGIDESSYIWNLENLTTGEKLERKTQSLEDFVFPSEGRWRLVLRVTDNCGNTGEIEDIEITIGIPDTDVPGDDTPIGDIDIFPGSCDGDCGDDDEIDPRDVGDDPVGDPDTPGGPDDPYDIVPDVTTNCPSGVDESSYRWTLTNLDTGASIVRAINRLEDFVFPSPGEWRLFMKLRDVCGSEIEKTVYVNIPGEISSGGISLGVDIRTNTLLGSTNFIGLFEGRANGGIAPYSYSWNFGNSESGIGKNVEHVYEDDGIYNISLSVIDSSGLVGTASVTIKVLDGDSCEQDADGDGIADCEDLCSIVAGDVSNAGCPIFEKKCDQSCSCKAGYVCDDSDPLSCGVSGICRAEFEIGENCLYDPKRGSVFGNTLCTTCPCNSSLDFLADIRRCDIVFPAITSPDGSQIYSQGNFWEVE